MPEAVRSAYLSGGEKYGGQKFIATRRFLSNFTHALANMSRPEDTLSVLSASDNISMDLY